MAVSSRGSGPAASLRAEARSCCALTSQSRTSSRLASSIQDDPTLQDFAFERSVDAAQPFDLRAGPDQDVLRQLEAAQAAAGAQRVFRGSDAVTPHDHEQIDVAVVVRRAPGM